MYTLSIIYGGVYGVPRALYHVSKHWYSWRILMDTQLFNSLVSDTYWLNQTRDATRSNLSKLELILAWRVGLSKAATAAVGTKGMQWNMVWFQKVQSIDDFRTKIFLAVSAV